MRLRQSLLLSLGSPCPWLLLLHSLCMKTAACPKVPSVPNLRPLGPTAPLCSPSGKVPPAVACREGMTGTVIHNSASCSPGPAPLCLYLGSPMAPSWGISDRPAVPPLTLQLSKRYEGSWPLFLTVGISFAGDGLSESSLFTFSLPASSARGLLGCGQNLEDRSPVASHCPASSSLHWLQILLSMHNFLGPTRQVEGTTQIHPKQPVMSRASF